MVDNFNGGFEGEPNSESDRDGESIDGVVGRSKDDGNRYMVEIAAEVVFIFNQVHRGIRLTVEPEKAIGVATQLTSSIIRSFTILGEADTAGDDYGEGF